MSEIRELAADFGGEGLESHDRRLLTLEGGRELELMPWTVYQGRNARLCRGNDDTCSAYRVKDHDLCAGHLRGQKAE